MKKIVVGLCLTATLALSGCAVFSKVQTAVADYTVSQNTVDKAMSAYDTVFLAPAKNYRTLHKTNPCVGSQTVSNANGLCARDDVVLKLQVMDKAVEVALGNLQAQINACTAAGQTVCSGTGALYTTLKGAISAAETYAASNGVK